MLSIITAIYNNIGMNRLFYKYLVKYTHYPFELIIIDNGSTDGSREFFEKQGAILIRNKGNYSYPYCQNQGIKEARYDVLVFMNNDILVSKDWDKRALAIMDENDLEIATCCATDRVETNKATYKSQKKWKYIRNPLLFLFGPTYWNLKLMHYLFYGNWEQFNEKRQRKFSNQVMEGIAGSNIIIKRSAIGKVGMWDERLQCADSDLFIRTKKRSMEVGDIKPVHLIPAVYLHHYVRLTLKKAHPAFADRDNLIPLKQKWNIDEVKPLLEKAGIIIH
jgi:GT2 family glycosyltransferase